MKIILIGLPGKVASAVATGAPAGMLHPFGVSSARHAGRTWAAADKRSVELVQLPELAATLKENEQYVALDFSPAALGNIAVLTALGMPVVIGATATGSKELQFEVTRSGGVVVLAPNLALPVVAIQSILKMAAAEFPGVFDEFAFQCSESHQAAKKDVSGTARMLLPTFAALGFDGATVESIHSIRSAAEQRELGVPEEYLGGHGWHRYEAISADQGVALALEHRINGRAAYVAGALQACAFARACWEEGERGESFDMVDVLRAGCSSAH